MNKINTPIILALGCIAFSINIYIRIQKKKLDFTEENKIEHKSYISMLYAQSITFFIVGIGFFIWFFYLVFYTII